MPPQEPLMPRFAAHMTRAMMTDLARESALAAVVAAGFRAVTLASPDGQELAGLKRDLVARDLEVALIDLPPGLGEGDAPDVIQHPGRVAEFRNSLAMAIDHARTLGCQKVNCSAGFKADGLLRATLVANLGYAGTMLAAAGIQLLVAVDIANFHALRAEVGNPNMYLLADTDALRHLADDLGRLLPLIGHVQEMGVADSAGLLADLDRLGYRGWVGRDLPLVD